MLNDFILFLKTPKFCVIKNDIVRSTFFNIICVAGVLSVIFRISRYIIYIDMCVCVCIYVCTSLNCNELV